MENLFFIPIIPTLKFIYISYYHLEIIFPENIDEAWYFMETETRWIFRRWSHHAFFSFNTDGLLLFITF